MKIPLCINVDSNKQDWRLAHRGMKGHNSKQREDSLVNLLNY
jgi:hypothetical protein